MKKHTLSKLFLYRHRYGIVYTLLGLIFVFTLCYLPSITPNGFSKDEMDSVVTSSNLQYNHIVSGDIINLPYHLLQKLTLTLFGLTTYGIKLPSIIFGGLLGILFILLLNRWFKNNVAILASIIAVLSSNFLYIKPKPFYSFIFAIALLLSLFTPYMFYLAIFIVFYALIHPHLRFTITHLPKFPLLLVAIIILATSSFLITNLAKTPGTFKGLLFMDSFSWPVYFENIKTAFVPFFKWSGMVESTFLAPLVGLASLALAVTGLISTYRGFFASRNSIATYLIIFTIIISGFNPYSVVLFLLPLAILIAHGFRYILNSWYGLFPENPYARVFGVLPIAIFLIIMIVSDISHFVFGYRYNPAVANEFNNDLSVIQANLSENDTLIVQGNDYSFYKLLEQKPALSLWQTKKITVKNQLPYRTDLTKNSSEAESSHAETLTPTITHFASLGNIDEAFLLQNSSSDNFSSLKSSYSLTRIVTNSKAQNSDRLYFYELKSSN